MGKIIFIFPAILVFIFSQKTTAQNNQYIFSHLTKENGLMSNEVRGVYQDKEGYIWIASFNGLQRYDGNRFVNYTVDINDPQALHGPSPNAMFEDSKHRFWVSADDIYQLNRSTGKFYNYSLHLSKGQTAVFETVKFIEDKVGGIWCYNLKGFFRLNESSNQFENVNALVGNTSGTLISFADRDIQGNIWYVTQSGFIKCYDPVSKKIYDKDNNPGHLKIFSYGEKISEFIISGDNAWFGYNKLRGLYQYNFKKDTVIKHEIPLLNNVVSHQVDLDIKISRVADALHGNVIACISEEGIVFFDEKQNKFVEVTINNIDPNGLHAQPGYFFDVLLFTDREGNDWIGGNRGLNIFNPEKLHFNFYGNENTENSHSAPGYTPNGFVQDPKTGDVYIAYYYPTAGLVRFSSTLEYKKQYLFKSGNETSNALNQLWCLFMDDDGVIWAPNQARSILKLDTKTDKLSLSGDTTIGNINIIQKDERGDIWMGTWKKGLVKKDHQSNEYTYFNKPAGNSILPPKNVTSLYFDGDSLLWVGTNHEGFYCFDRIKNEFVEYYIHEINNTSSVSNNFISRILPYNQDTLILATFAGINFFDKRKKTFSHLSIKDGLPGNIVQTIELDDKHNLWVGCTGGFCKVSMPGRSITSYGSDDGIADDAFNNAPFLKMQNGRYLVPASKGFMSFIPSEISAANPPPAPVITGFKVFDKNINTDSIVTNDSPIRLSYKQNSFIIEFASLEFSSSSKLKYFYQLVGADKDWILADQGQSAHYNHLENGHYIFKVKCENRDGLTSENITELRVFVYPPFWKTGWFRLIFILLIGTIFYILLRWQRKRREEKQQLQIEYEKKIAAVEMNMLRAQMNPHFIFNSLNSINTFILKNDSDNATEYLQKFSSLVRLILDNSRNEWILLENEIKALELYIELEALRFENIFSYSINVSPGINQSSVWVPPLIIQPYAENAIRHGLINRKEPGGKLDINVWRNNGQLMMQVEDNGIGRAAAEKMKKPINKLHQQSHGMKITAERLDIVNEVYKVNAKVQVTDLNENGNTGTKVLITIQYKDHADNNH